MKTKIPIYKGVTILTLIFIVFTCIQQVKNIKPFQVQKLLPESHPVRLRYEEFNRKYDDENKVFLLVKSESIIEDSVASKVLNDINSHFKFFNGVNAHTSLNTAKYFTFDKLGFQLIPFINDKNIVDKTAQIKLETDFWKQSLRSTDKKSLLVAFTLSSKLERKNRVPLVKRMMNDIDQIVHPYPSLETHYLGTEVANHWFTLEMLRNQTVITPLLMLFIGVFFLYLFRSFKAVAYSYMVIILSYASVIILITLIEDGIGPYSSFALIFVSIIATSDLIHFLTHYQMNNSDLNKTLNQIKAPCLLTSITTAIGFSSLVLNENVPVRYFGLYCSIGTFICYFVTFHFLPLAISAFSLSVPSRKRTSHRIDKIWTFLLRFHKKIIIAFVLVSSVFIYKSLGLTIDDNLYRKFVPSHPLTLAVNNFSDGLNFVGSIDIIIKKKNTDILSSSSLKEVELFQNELLQIPVVSHIKSFTQLHKNIQEEVEGFPKRNIESLINMLYDYGVLNSFYKRTSNEMRTVVFLKSLNSVSLEKAISSIERIGKDHQALAIQVNGFASIRNYINQNVIRSFIKSFSTSLVLIFILFLILFKSFKWALVAMTPNIFPLLTISGLMGIFNITMESNLVILVSITIGIAVDDTIHFVHSLRNSLTNGDNLEVATKKAMNKTLFALVSTTTVFFLSFPTFFLSDLKLFVQVGIFILLSLFAALLADFLLLPSLLIYFKRKKNDNI